MSCFAYQGYTQQLESHNYLQKLFTMSKRPVFLMKFVRAKTISGPNKPIMAAYHPDPKKHMLFYGFPRVNYVFFLPLITDV